MATHRAPSSTITRTLANGVRQAAPLTAHGVAVLFRRTARASWRALRLLGMVMLALVWVGLALLLVILSTCTGKQAGSVMRRTVTRDMLAPLAEGAREVLAARRAAAAEAAADALSESTADDVWPDTLTSLWSAADMEEAARDTEDEPITLRAVRRLQSA